MNRTFTPQEQQQLNSTNMYDDSAVLDDGNIKESVANREQLQEIRNKRILIVDDEPDITFTLKVILEENGFNEVDVYIDAKIKGVFVTASQVNYEALRELFPVDRFDTSDEKNKVAILKGSQERNEDRIHIIRKPVEIKEFIQKVTKELQQGILGIEKTRCYKKIEFKQTRQQQY
ncbi:MAG TPA: hypothetical protein VEL11_18065 [Candidatus Bathyarchaeia archaeon]|nr:hypothetical protein [Candidatus Bathyarchaeia archaeon]